MSEQQFELYLRLLGKFLKLTVGQQTEIADELRDHLEARLEELSRSGMDRDAAIRLALEEFGDAALLAEHFSRIAREQKRRLVMRCTLGTVAAGAVALMFGMAFWPAESRIAVAPGSVVAEDSAVKPVEVKPTAVASSAAESERDRAVRDMLESTTVECEFIDTPLSDLLEFLGQRLTVDIYVPRAEFGSQLETTVTIQLKHAKPSARTVLELALRESHLGYTVRDGIVMICNAEDAMEIRVYDCGALGLKERADRDHEPQVPPGAVGGEFPAPARPHAGMFAELVMQLVRPDTWAEAGGTSQLAMVDSRLIVKAPADTHREIKMLLEQLTVTKTAAK